MRNNKSSLFFFIILLIWYSLIFFDIPRLTTEGNASVFSLLGLLEFLLLIVLVAYLKNWKYTDYLNLSILLLWAVLQYQGNWKYFLFPPSTDVLESYYEHFQGTLRILAESETRIIPDAYHIILGLLLLLNIINVVVKIIRDLANNSHS
ncbi:MAG: hypothetical protein U5L09_17060 [Bacteroidales bacterium]|nr:hypothetical protein [Bacteroidales bacterium]